MFLVYVVLCLFLVVSTSAIDCLERLVSEMTCYVSSGTLNPTHSLTQLQQCITRCTGTDTQVERQSDRHTQTDIAILVSPTS